MLKELIETVIDIFSDTPSDEPSNDNEPSFGSYDPDEKYVNTITNEECYGSEIKENAHGGTHSVDNYTQDSYADAESSDNWKKKEQ